MKSNQQAAARLPQAARLGRFLQELGDAGAYLVTARADVRYLTGFSGSNGWLLMAPDVAAFLTDPRYEQQAAQEIAGVPVVVSGRGLPQAAAEVFADGRVERIGFDPADVTVSTLEKLEEVIAAEWVPLPGVVAGLRACKDETEREAIRNALRLTEDALQEVVAGIRVGVSERQVAAELEHACRLRGAEGMAFDTIVASGPRTALPHGVASDRRLVAGEPVMIDMGCRLAGYCADITRNVWCGAEPDPGWLELHGLVDRARETAIAAVAPGVEATAVDAAARDVVAEGGHGDGFVHGTGHGVGLDIHERPTLSGRSDEVLRAGMVATIEPAVYLEGRYGVRIEDMVCVSDGGCERLTTLGTEPILATAS